MAKAPLHDLGDQLQQALKESWKPSSKVTQHPIEEAAEEYRVELFWLGLVVVVWAVLVLLLHRTPLTAGIYVVSALAVLAYLPTTRGRIRELFVKADVQRRWNRAVRHCNWGHPNWGAHKPGRIRLYDLERMVDEVYAHKEATDSASLQKMAAQNEERAKAGLPLSNPDATAERKGTGYKGKIQIGKGLSCRDVIMAQGVLGAEMRMLVEVEEDKTKPHEATIRFLESSSKHESEHLAEVQKDEDLLQ